MSHLIGDTSVTQNPNPKKQPIIMRTTTIFALACLTVSQAAFAQVYTTPAGYTTVQCKANSDTIVGLPLRQSSAYSGTLSAAPDTASVPGSAVLSLSGTPGFTVNAYANSYYVKFANTEPTPAAGDGQWFTITANTAGTLTVDLNGGTIAAVSGARLEVLKFWTLNELFPLARSTTSAATTGTAIVATADVDEIMTQVLIPNISGVGINLAPTNTYFLMSGSGWKRFGSSIGTDFGNTFLWPDVYFIIRNPSAVGASTNYTVSGECEMGKMVIPLSTRIAGQQDNFVGIPRGVDVTLNQLNLGGTSSFVTTTDVDDIQDQLMVFNNASAVQNRAPSATYYYYNGAWRKFGQSAASNFGTDVISVGSGFMIRKAPTNDGATHFWINAANY